MAHLLNGTQRPHCTGVVICEVEGRKGGTKAGEETAQESSSTQNSRRSVGQRPWARETIIANKTLRFPCSQVSRNQRKRSNNFGHASKKLQTQAKVKTFYRSSLSFKPNLVPVSVCRVKHYMKTFS